MVQIVDLPLEILQTILVFTDPADIGRIVQTCKALMHAVDGNTSFFRQVYLAHLDAPARPHEVDWEQAVKDYARLQRVCGRRGLDQKRNELEFVYNAVVKLLQHSATSGPRAPRSATHSTSRNASFLASLFDDHENQQAFLARSFLFERARGELSISSPFSWPPRDSHQQSAKLHCLYGVPLLHARSWTDEAPRPGPSVCAYTFRITSTSNAMAPFACSKVYDLREYTSKTLWGPFMHDGSLRTDWEKVEAIMIVIGANLRRLGINEFPVCKNFWETPFAGVWPGSYLPLPVPETSTIDDELDSGQEPSSRTVEPETAHPSSVNSGDFPLGGVPKRLVGLEDPYDITGTWIRAICFLDYTDFHFFNFGLYNDRETGCSHRLPHNVPRRAIHYSQATRMIIMKLFVTRIEPPGKDDGQDLPVVFLGGTSKVLDRTWGESGDYETRGRVSLTPEGGVRWSVLSIHHGEERWGSECIQIGGVRSAKGVMGSWFDNDHSQRGPVGPTAFWKVSDRVPQNDQEHHNVLDAFMPMFDPFRLGTDPEDDDEDNEDEDEEEDDDDESDEDGEEDEDGDEEMQE